MERSRNVTVAAGKTQLVARGRGFRVYEESIDFIPDDGGYETFELLQEHIALGDGSRPSAPLQRLLVLIRLAVRRLLRRSSH